MNDDTVSKVAASISEHSSFDQAFFLKSMKLERGTVLTEYKEASDWDFIHREITRTMTIHGVAVKSDGRRSPIV